MKNEFLPHGYTRKQHTNDYNLNNSHKVLIIERKFVEQITKCKCYKVLNENCFSCVLKNVICVYEIVCFSFIDCLIYKATSKNLVVVYIFCNLLHNEYIRRIFGFKQKNLCIIIFSK